MKMHKSVTLKRVMSLIKDSADDYPGICLACGDDAYGCEPDAREYPCESCNEHQVYGAEEILLMIA